MDSSSVTSISQLATLQDLDQQCSEKLAEVESLQAEIHDLDHQLAEQRTAVRAIRAEHEALESRRKELEAHLADEESKLKDRRMRLNRVRNEKELVALRREIEVGKETNQQLEEDILRSMELLEGLTAKLTDGEQVLQSLEGQTAETLVAHRSRIETLSADLTRDRERRGHMVRELDPALLRKYEQIFARRGGTAVVEVRSGICLGCHMNLPPQFFNELQRSREVRLCPNCHRILYCRPERLDDSAAER